LSVATHFRRRRSLDLVAKLSRRRFQKPLEEVDRNVAQRGIPAQNRSVQKLAFCARPESRIDPETGRLRTGNCTVFKLSRLVKSGYGEFAEEDIYHNILCYLKKNLQYIDSFIDVPLLILES
jgi:hypothetical protein